MRKIVSVLSLLAFLCTGLPGVISDDLEASFDRLQQAEALNDPAVIKQLAAETCALARKVASQPAPESDLQKEVWTQQVERARSVEVYTEYALYTAAIQNEPAVTVDLLATLAQQNPKSKYLDEGYSRYFLALTQTGAGAKIPAIAEAALANLPNNEDLLMVLADSALGKKQNDKALSYADRLAAVLTKHPKPESVSAEYWQHKRDQQLGRAHWIAGVVHCDKTDYMKGDKSLRLALPLIGDNKDMRAAALFYLGVANFQLGAQTLNKARVQEAIKFSEEAASFKNPYTMQAWRNVQAMRAHVAQMR
jgi:tetratricopeptide (TPR) repeat protein